MKKNLFVQISFILLIVLSVGSCSKQKEKEKPNKAASGEIPMYMQPSEGGPCPRGQHLTLEWDIDKFNFHRPKTHCTSGFFVCVELRFTPTCKDDHITYYSAITPDGIAHVWAQVLQGGLIEIHFPIELVNTPGYTIDDLSTFTVDEEWDASPYTNNPLIMEVGEYKTTFTQNEIIVIVPIKP